MDQDTVTKDAGDRPHDFLRSPAYYLEAMDPDIRSSFTEPQLEAVKQLLEASIPRPAPKLVDLRFFVDLLAYRFYVVLLVGKHRRQRQRSDVLEPMARKGNVVAAIMLLIALNLLISAFVLLIAYAIKSAIGYSVFPESHLGSH